MMPGLPDTSIPQCKYNCRKGPCLELFQAIGHFEPTSIDGHQALNMIGKVRLHKLQIKTNLFLEDIITSSKEVLKEFEANMALEIRKLGNQTRETAENKYTVKETACS